MEYEDTSSQEQEQKKHVIRRDKVVATKVTEKELSQIKDTANQCGMTRSDFIRARALGYKPRQRLSDRELDGLRQLAACRTDMVNFTKALHGLSDNEKIRLFRHEETMLEWYENAYDRPYEILIVVFTDVIVKRFPFTITPCIFTLILWDGIVEITIR